MFTSSHARVSRQGLVAAALATIISVPFTSVPATAAAGCAVPGAAIGTTSYAALTLKGNLPIDGGTLSDATGEWMKLRYFPTAATRRAEQATARDLARPSAVRPFAAYHGSYHVESSTAPTTGCFNLVTTTDGSTIDGIHQATASGFANPGDPSTHGFTLVAHGRITSISLKVSPSGTGRGAFRLDDGATGTITINSVQIVRVPPASVGIPTSSERVARSASTSVQN